ncbi:MAG: (d)CMP kinase [Chitinophagaceae bacterium]|nr:(d)CMP kinase [Chitinophagaceae bacterium]
MTEKKIIITLDGWSSCGKSTLAKALARELGYVFVDSGAMYRAITLYFLNNKVDWSDLKQIEKALANIELTFVFNPTRGASDIILNGQNVESSIRDMAVASRVSEVAAIPLVRQFAVQQQQRLGKNKGIVMDGRDIGTVVFPDAELKIFMTASKEIRVKRRFQELVQKDAAITIEAVRENLEQRDHMDSNRKESPLRQANDARVLDNTDLNEQQQFELALGWAKEVIAQPL